MAETEASYVYSFLPRLWEYTAVTYAVGTATNCYSYAKTYNNYSKRLFEKAESYAQPIVSASLTKLEEYSHKPIVEGVILRADAYGCYQLDKLDSRIQRIKDLTPKAVHAVDHAIHGTLIESGLIKTVGVVDTVVDALLPPKDNDQDDDGVNNGRSHANGHGNGHGNGHSNGFAVMTNDDDGRTWADHVRDGPREKTVVSVASPVINKLKLRVSKESVLRLPAQTYGIAIHLPQVQACVAILNTLSENIYASKQVMAALNSLSGYLTATKQVTQESFHKSAERSRAGVDYLSHSLHRVTSSVSSLVDLLKKVDPAEARATLEELSVMINTSKDNVTKVVDNLHLGQKFRQDGTALLTRAGDAVEAGYTYIANSDIVAIKNAFNSLESAVQGVIASFSIQAEQSSE